MKGYLIFLFCWFCFIATAQKIQVLAPGSPVVKGTAFQVQYVVTQPQDFVSAGLPSFDSCRIVSGPNYYGGIAVVDGSRQPIQNITYTLVPLRTGLLRLGALPVRFRSGEVWSEETAVTVVDAPKASYKVSSSYTDVALYQPSGNYEKMLSENLFIKTIVSKQVAYVGEAIVASFKLYSRLQSSSEALNAPSFYGFSVTDMLPVHEAHTGVEVVNGKVYNTAILRKVQLYPVQAGLFTVDAMQVQNSIEFYDSVRRQVVQKNKILVSPVVAVRVLPLPGNESDAVGRLHVAATIDKLQLRVNETGRLVVRIAGAGNFIQLGEPEINWPAGVDVLDKKQHVVLDKNTVPVSGYIDHAYRFSVNDIGSVALPAISFSCFDPVQKKIVNTTTPTILLKVMPAGRKPLIALPVLKRENGGWLLVVVGLCFLFVCIFGWTLRRRRRKPSVAVHPTKIAAQPDYRTLLAALEGSEGREGFVSLRNLLQQWVNTEKPAAVAVQSAQKMIDACNEVAYSPLNKQPSLENLLEKARQLILGQ